MAELVLLQGELPEKAIPLTGDSLLIGRQDICDLQLASNSVSRAHARIEIRNGQCYLEDLGSNNGSYLNNVQVQQKTKLAEGDEIAISEFVFRFHVRHTESTRQVGADSDSTADTDARRKPNQSKVRIVDGKSDTWRINQTVSMNTLTSKLTVNPEVKLKAVLEITKSLGRVMELDDVLERILGQLFQIFPQMDHGFVLLKDHDKNKLMPVASKSRRQRADDEFPISRTVTNQAISQGEAILSADASSDDRFADAVSLAGLGIRSLICVPLMGTSSDALGVIQIASDDPIQPFDEDDLDLLVSVASQASLAIEHSRLHDSMLKQRVVECELEFARQLQLSFLPQEDLQCTGYKLSHYYSAARSVGGDYFDHFSLSDGRIAVSLADVSGKGVPAAMLMAKYHSRVRDLLRSSDDLTHVMNRLNTEVNKNTSGFPFITCVIAVADTTDHVIKVTSAGHPPVLWKRADGEIQETGFASGPPLGIEQGCQFEETTLTLAPGETLVFYSDGVTEAVNIEGRIFGNRRFEETLKEGSQPVGELVSEVVSRLDAFRNGAEQSDDICLLGLQRL